MSNIRRRNTKGNLKVELIKLGAVIALFAVLVVALKLFVIDRFQSILESNALFSVIFITVTIVVLMTNLLFTFAYMRIAGLVVGGKIGFIKSILPITSEFELKNLYYENECQGVLPYINIFISTVNFVVFLAGMLYLNFRYGFLVVFDPHSKWIIAVFATYFVHVLLKCFTLGVIYASYTDYISKRFVASYYLKPILVLGFTFIYFIVLGPLSAFLDIQLEFVQSRIVNAVLLLSPFLFPVVSVWDAISLSVKVEHKLASDKNEEEEDYYDDEY